MKKRILLTGFEPFGPHRVNSSWEAIRALDATRIGTSTIRSLLLPVEYSAGPRKLTQALQEYRPDICLSFGLSAGEGVKLERLARNGHRGKSDNAGLVPKLAELEPGRDAVFSATLPLSAMKSALENAGIPVCYSDDAGGYVCNALFFRLAAATAGTGMAAGFIHLPPADEFFTQSRLEEVVACCITACLGTN